jgi:hypothetical protein
MKVALLFFTNLHCSKSKGTCYKEWRRRNMRAEKSPFQQQ